MSTPRRNNPKCKNWDGSVPERSALMTPIVTQTTQKPCFHSGRHQRYSRNSRDAVQSRRPFSPGWSVRKA